MTAPYGEHLARAKSAETIVGLGLTECDGAMPALGGTFSAKHDSHASPNRDTQTTIILRG